jgi:hypothetical protein
MTAKQTTPLQQVAKGVLYAILLLLAALLLLGFAVRNAFILQVPYHVFFGWALHGWKALPPFFGKWQAAVLPLGCLILAGALAHRFIRRWVGLKRPAWDWRVWHTTGVLSLVLLCSAAAIATSGMVHQFLWLGQGKFLKDSRSGEMTHAVSNARQLSLYLFEFHDDNGRYPHRFDELEAPVNLFWFTPDGREAPEPFVLLRPGSGEIALADEPLIVSPLLGGGTAYVVGFGDSSVRRVTPSHLRQMLAAAEITDVR